MEDEGGLVLVSDGVYRATVRTLLVPSDCWPVVKPLGGSDTVELAVAWYDRDGREVALSVVNKSGVSKHYVNRHLLLRL